MSQKIYLMSKKTRRLVTILILTFLPIIFWILMQPLSHRFVSTSAILTSLGQISALVGMSLFAISLILSARVRFLDKFFGGLNVVYIDHHVLGGLAFIFLLFHPLFLAYKFALISLKIGALFLLPGHIVANNFGWMSLVLMIILLVITFFIPLRYHFWKQTHKFLGLAFFLGGLHMFFITSDVSRYFPLRIYMILLSLIALVAFVYRTIGYRRWVHKFSYIVKQVNKLNGNVVEIILKPTGPKMVYISGQFIFISFDDKKIGEESHPYSIASASEEDLSVIVKNLGDYTSRLSSLLVGTKAKIEGPFGTFNYHNFSGLRQIWIAGGIGITPFIGMAKTMVTDSKKYDVDLYYCAKTREELVYFDKIKEVADLSRKIKIMPFCANVEGYLTGEVIKKISGDMGKTEFLLCGPPMMMKTLRSQLRKIGVKNMQIHSEDFSF